MQHLRQQYRLPTISAIALAVVMGTVAGPGWSQDQGTGDRIQSPGLRPTVPLLEPRPPVDADLRFQTQRQDADRQPVAGFLQSLQGSDVALDVVVGQGRLLVMKKPIATEAGDALIAVGDPTIVDFDVLPNPRMIRLTGKRPGVTDLSITTSDEQTHVFEIHVGYDMVLMNAQLRQLFPDADIKVSQLRGHLIIEGQARSTSQLATIEGAVRAYADALNPVVRSGGVPGAGQPMNPLLEAPPVPPAGNAAQAAPSPSDGSPPPALGPVAATELGARSAPGESRVEVQIINLMRVPGVHQVMLQVRIGELNRTGLREMGADWFVEWGHENRIGTNLLGAQQALKGLAPDARGLKLTSSATAFGLFPSGNVEIVLRALRENSILNILAEPNLMALSGQKASFLAGGQFPVPVPQASGNGFTTTTIQFKDFGVSLSFIPYVLEDGTIRLQVAPEVSSIDEALGVTTAVGAQPVPGLNTRRVDTVVELKQGMTLALAGLLQVQLDAKTDRIPGLGDLPYLGPFFSNSSHKRVEKELMVLVTPYLVSAMPPEEVPPLPGCEIQDPNDCEFYFLNRLEGRTGRPFRSTMSWDNPLHLVEKMRLEKKYVSGPVGFSE